MIRTMIGIVAAMFALATPVAAQSFLQGEFDPAIPTLEEVAGHRSGEQITRPDMVLDYMQVLAEAAPDRTRLMQNATSSEGRPLVYAVISSRENMARIDSIQIDKQRIANGGAPGADSVPVTWLSYGVHGNEISSLDAALALACHLLAVQGDELVDTVLANSVVIIDPMQNPDGRARFTNGYYQQLGIAVIVAPARVR